MRRSRNSTDGASCRWIAARWSFAAVACFAASTSLGQQSDTAPTDAPAPPTKLEVTDSPDDAGTKLDLKWEISPDDVDAEPRKVRAYRILRKESAEEEFSQVGELPYGSTEFTDPHCSSKQSYVYQVVAVAPSGATSAPAETDEPVSPSMQLFDASKLSLLGIMAVLCGSVLWFIRVARSGRDLKIRKIAGLEAVDEAVGRATEMGRTCLFIPGIQDMNDIQTVAGITVLGRVAKTAAEYDARIEVPTSRALVMTAARETVHSAFLSAGRPDAYNEDLIYYVTDEQFGYVAAVGGTMMREKPAACFYMGAFFAESLLLAETGNSVGAIQVAGTAMPSQLPFFVAACDYTLIGEEFFAASAYLSGEPEQLGSLKGQDVGKLIVGAFLIGGCINATLVALFPDVERLQDMLDFVLNTMVGKG